MRSGRFSISTSATPGGFVQAEPNLRELSDKIIVRTQMDPVRLLVVDDHEVARRGIRYVLADKPGMEIIGEVANGEEAITMIRRLHPDIVLLDISLPGISGSEVASTIQQISPGSRVICVSQYDSPLIAKDALLTGACGYVVKSDAALDLLPAIAAVQQGHTFVSRTVRALGWT